MSGRGRGLTLPAWMTEQQKAQPAQEPISSSANYGNNRDDRYADARDSGYSNNYPSNTRDNNRYSDARDNNYSNNRGSNYPDSRDNGNRYNDRDSRPNDSRTNQYDSRDVRNAEPSRDVRPEPPVRDDRPSHLPDNYQSKRRKKTSGWDQTSAAPVADQQVLQALSKAVSSGAGSANAAAKAGTRIYVGSIHYDLREPDIVALFQSFGTVTKSEMTMDPQTGRSKGFCFLEYETVEQADAAMAMDGFDLAGRRIKVGRPFHGQGGAMANNGASLNLAMSMGMQMTNQVAAPAPVNPMMSGLSYVGQSNSRDLTIGGQLLLPSSVGSSNNYVSGDTHNCLLIRYVSALVPISELNNIFSSFGELRRCRFVEAGKVSGMPSNARAAVVEFANPAVATSTAPAMAGFLIGDMEIATEVISRDRADALLTVDDSSFTTVVLRDMVTLQDIDDPYLKDELAEEGGQYGRLQNVLIEVRDAVDGPRRKEVVVELLYFDPADAHKAHRALNGRAFGGKPINAILAPAK